MTKAMGNGAMGEEPQLEADSVRKRTEEAMEWKRKAEVYDVIVECFCRLHDNGHKANPLVEAMLDAVIQAKRLREQINSKGGT